MNVRLNPAVRLSPPSEVTGPRWIAENLLERRRFKVSKEGAAALIASNRPQEAASLAARLSEMDASPYSVNEWAAVIKMMQDSDLIVEESLVDTDPKIGWLVSLQKAWVRVGWCEAADYHALTFDYPCIDYSEALGTRIDRDRMLRYQHESPDNDRYKLDYVGYDEVPMDPPSTDVLLGTAWDVWVEPPPPARLGFESLRRVVEFTFGVTGLYKPRTNAAPLILRTSPSGGGRHPSEGYVAVIDVPSLNPGWYHVTMSPFGLRRIPDVSVDTAQIESAFPETVGRFPYQLKAIVVVTSVFERNMYRYREPRTFRTVHIDAGHLAGTIRLLAKSVGVSAVVYYCDAAERVEGLLGLDGMREGYMFTAALGDGVLSASPSESAP